MSNTPPPMKHAPGDRGRPRPTPSPAEIGASATPVLAGRGPPRLPTPPPSLPPELRDAIARRPARSRASRRLALLGAIAIALGAMAAALYAFGGPSHAFGRPDFASRWILGGVIALAAAATLLSLPRRSMLPPPAWKLATVAVAVPAVVGLWLVGWHAQYVDPFWRAGAKCFALTMLSAPGPLLVLFLAGPRLAPMSPRLSGAALGAASGAWAAVVVELWCPLALPQHVLFGHVVPLVTLALLGALLGGRLLTPRRSSPSPGLGLHGA